MPKRMMTVSLIFWLAARCIAQQTAMVHLVPETESGQGLKNVQIHMVESNSKKDRGSTFRGFTASDIPYGYYDLKISTPSYKTYERRVEVFDREITLRVMMRFATDVATGAERFEGIVTPLGTSNRKRWVLLFPLAGSPGEVLEASIQADGRFSLLNTGGSYLLAIVQGDEMLWCRKVYLGHNTPLLKITLP